MNFSEHTPPEYPRCDHDTQAVRWRVRRNGIGVWVSQCVDCGQEIRALKKTCQEVIATTEKAPFDDELADAWSTWAREEYQQRHSSWLARRQHYTRIEQEQRDKEWWDEYNHYLTTDTWKKRRALVLKRDEHLCQCCLTNRATEVHHLSYTHVGNERLWELQSICTPCHDRITQEDRESRGAV
jgi:5-methylcytosine-specific restriction endonuclease McrA